MVMEYTPVVSLKLLDQPKAWNLMLSVITATMHCHEMNIVHGDIKVTNIGFDGRFKLLDFGSSAKLNERNKALIRGATYVPPEFDCRNPTAGKEFDVWTIGLLAKTLQNKHLLPHGHHHEEFIKACMCIEPEKRLKSHELIEAWIG
jgi:serine/threonine protein kinase